MRWLKGRKREYWIFKKIDGDWQEWDGPFTQKVAERHLEESYDDRRVFRVVRVDYEMMP